MRTAVTLSLEGSLGRITLVPEEGKPPTLDPEVMGEFEAVLAEIESKAAELSAVVLSSASQRYFCAGANLAVMERIDRETMGPWIRRGHALMNRLEALPLPVVARVEGYAMGGGLELAMACDLIFASAQAQFAQSETKLGLVTGWGGSFRLARRVGVARAKEIAYTGRMVSAGEAASIGLIEWEGPAAELDARIAEFTRAVDANSRVATREAKHMFQALDAASVRENADLEEAASLRCLSEGDAARRLTAFFAARRSRRA